MMQLSDLTNAITESIADTLSDVFVMLGSQRYCILCLQVKTSPWTFHNARTDTQLS